MSASESGARARESATQEWTPVNGGHVVDQIIEQVRDRIYASLAPGDWIGTEVELAEKFGVSRPAMRDAVRALRTLGLVEVRVGTGGGLRVAYSDPRRLADAVAVQLHQLDLNWRDVSDALITIEPGLAALAARRRRDEDIDWLRLIIQQHHALIDERRAFFQSTGAFHFALASAAGNPALMLMIKALRIHLDGLFASLDDTAVDRARVIRYHEAILVAVEGREPIRAAQLMQEHDEGMQKGRRPPSRSPRPSA